MDARRFNPNHVAAGQAGGGQFAPASGSGSAKGGAGKRPTPTNAHPVGMGETGKRVHDLQERLNALGAHLKVDGIFGPKTRAAVEAFQKSHGLKVDALVGPKTTAALRLKHPGHHHKAGHHHKTGHKATGKAAAPAPTAKRSDTWAAEWARAWTR